MSRNPNCNFGGPMKELGELWDKFKNDKKVNKVLADPDGAFYGLIQSEFKMPLETLAYRNDISKGELKGFKKRIDKLITNIGKGEIHGKIASMFYTPEAFAKADPAAGQLLDNFLHTSHYYKGNQAESDRLWKTVMSSLGNEMKLRGLSDNTLVGNAKLLSRQTAQAKAQALESKIMEAIAAAKNGEAGAMDRLNRLKTEEAKLYSESELQVYKEMLHLIEGDTTKPYGTEGNGLKEIVHAKYKSLVAKEAAKTTNRKKIDYEKVIESLTDSDF